MDDAALLWMAGLVGLAVGSFLNVCAFRWPRGESVVRPRSRCGACGVQIASYDNVPVLSWLLLRGRCRRCSAPISVQYPLVELATGFIWAGSLWLAGPSWEALRGAVFLTILLGIALSDARFYIIPDELSLGGAVLGLALATAPGGRSFADALLGGVGGFVAMWLVGVVGTWLVRKTNPSRLENAFDEHEEGRADRAVRARIARLRGPGLTAVLVFTAVLLTGGVGRLFGLGALFATAATTLAAIAVLLAWAEAFEQPTFTTEPAPASPTPGTAPEAPEGAGPAPDAEEERASALGGGDIRMMALIGAYLGLSGVLLTVFGGSVLALLAALPLTLAFKQLIPLGIFLAFGGALAYVAGDTLVSWYLGLMGL